MPQSWTTRGAVSDLVKVRPCAEVYVYRRAGQPCHVCGSTVLTDELLGRSLYWWPTCQSG